MQLLQLFLVFFKVGILGFGGGYAILPLIYQDVQAFGLMSADDFSNLVALSQVTPGPIAVNAATYVGFRVAGILGAVVATFAVSLPSFAIIMLVLSFLDRFKQNPWVQSILSGIRPATVGLMASAFLFMAQTALFPRWNDGSSLFSNLSSPDFVAIVIFLISFALILSKRLGAISITLLGGALGVLFSLLSSCF